MNKNQITFPSRTIKFRIWNNKNRSWVHGPHENPSLDGVNLFGETIMFGYLLHGVSIEDYNECIPLQYTGLKDKNGREIFEGDIVKIHRDPKYSLTIDRFSFVIFERGCFCVKDGSIPVKDNLTFTEVIGNIFENPDLAEKAQKSPKA